MNKFKDSGHLFRLASVFAAGFLLLVVAREGEGDSLICAIILRRRGTV